MNSDKVYIYPSLGGSYSMKRYLEGVINGLEANDMAFEIVQPKGSGLKAKYIDYPLLTWKKRKASGAHLVISERYAYLIPLMNLNSIVVCHDLHTLYEEAQTPKIHEKVYRYFLNKMFKARKVACVSHHTKSDLLKYMPKFKRHKGLKVVHNGIEQFWAKKEKVDTNHQVLKSVFDSKKVLFSVGTDAWYKNNQWSLYFLAGLNDYHLLRIGSFNSQNSKLIEDLNLASRITQLEAISDSDLKFCYQNAEALLFPSVSEGFGWPALEAALSACPVISDGAGATQEVFVNSLGLIPTAKAKEFLSSSPNLEVQLNYIEWSQQIKLLVA